MLLAIVSIGTRMNRWVAALRLTGVGFFIGGAIVMGIFIGLWLDKWLGTNLLWLVGLILGLIVAFLGVFKMLLPLLREKRDKENS
jgi:F0F1-type ATP synthase assembly protein I